MKTLNLKRSINTLTIMSILLGISFSSCEKKKTTPPNPNDEELITTVKILYTDSAGFKPFVQSVYRDLDGDGGNAPTAFDTIKLEANTTYNASILLLDESKTPVDTISNEVLEEDNEHLFCFNVANANCIIKRTDSDGTYEVGLASKWTTKAASNGTVQISLRHQPDGTKDGTCNPGSADIDLGFQLKIQ